MYAYVISQYVKLHSQKLITSALVTMNFEILQYNFIAERTCNLVLSMKYTLISFLDKEKSYIQWAAICNMLSMWTKYIMQYQIERMKVLINLGNQFTGRSMVIGHDIWWPGPNRMRTRENGDINLGSKFNSTKNFRFNAAPLVGAHTHALKIHQSSCSLIVNVWTCIKAQLAGFSAPVFPDLESPPNMQVENIQIWTGKIFKYAGGKHSNTYSPNEEVMSQETFCKLASGSASQNPLQSQFKLLFQEFGVKEIIEQNTFLAIVIVSQTPSTHFWVNKYGTNNEPIIPTLTMTGGYLQFWFGYSHFTLNIWSPTWDNYIP